MLIFLVRKVRAMVRDADWLWLQLGMRMGGKSLLPTWFIGDIIYGKNQCGGTGAQNFPTAP